MNTLDEDFESYLPFEGAFTGVQEGGETFTIFGTVYGVIRNDSGEWAIIFRVIIKQPVELEGWKAEIFHKDFRTEKPGLIKLIEPK